MHSMQITLNKQGQVMNLSQYIISNPSATLADVRLYEESIERMVSPDMVVSILTETDSVLLLQEKAKTDPKAAGFLLALSGTVSEYNLMNSSAVGVKQQLLLVYLLSIGAITESCKLGLLSYANYMDKPFLNTTQLQFNHAKKIYTEKQVTGYTNGRNIKLTLIDIIPENCTATTWGKDNGFDYENIGKISHLSPDNQVYKIKMNSVNVDGDLFVRIPFANFNFTIELM